MKKKMIIVGAGISGLSTGYYAQLNGYDAEIFEMHNIPGGLCTAWTRKGYTFDTSMHFLSGSKKGELKRLWDELGISDNHQFHYHDSSMSIEGEGRSLSFSTDRLKMEQQMLAISPDDKDLIREYLDLIHGESPLLNMPLDAPEVMSFIRKIKMIASMKPLFKLFKKYSGVTLQDFASRFTDKFLARAVRYHIDSPGWPMPGFPAAFLKGIVKSSVTYSGYPLGGSKKVVFGIAERFEKLGGKIHYKKRVENLILEKGCARGIQLDNGEQHFADVIVWCADGHHLHFDMLKEKYMDRKLKQMYSRWTPVLPIVHVMFGVNMDLSGEPHTIIYKTEKPIKVGNREFDWINIMSHCFDKSTAPAGKSAIEVWYGADYDYWKELSRDKEQYKSEKNRIAEETAKALDVRWPGFKDAIEMIDVPTPVTYERYTGNWRGSPDGWYLTESNFKDQGMKMKVRGLKNLYTVSQWCAPYTGTVSTSLGGRQLIQILCRKNGVEFKTG
ncbi:MAG: NAD(P)/FAD-dependent oxidoreductase [Spirochaetaceae bacterium]|nr:NAD(P)/FAD-dependent oxidoreductase [Spirochaetaceae bacterium]